MGFYDKNPCRGCENRHTGCHAECDLYKDWKGNLEENQNKRNEYLRNEDNIIRYQRLSYDRQNQRKGGYKKK